MRAVDVAVQIPHASRPTASAAGLPVEPELRQLPSITPWRACYSAGAQSPEGSVGSPQPLHTGGGFGWSSACRGERGATPASLCSFGSANGSRTRRLGVLGSLV